MTEPERIDFKQLLDDLDHVGVTPYKVAIMMTEAGLRTQYTQVQRWMDGAKPRHDQGELIRAIHAEHIPRETLQL